MNKISFKGSNAVIRDIVTRIFASEGGSPRLPERALERYGTRLGEIAGAKGIDPAALEILFDYLIANGATKAKLDRLAGDGADELVELAHDVELLRRFRGDGTIIDVRIVDEWPF